MKTRLDVTLAEQGLCSSRSQAESLIKLGHVNVNGQAVTKAGFLISGSDKIQLNSSEHYVSRAGLKLASVANKLNIDFTGKVVLDVGSSTGGFTDFALQNGAKKVIAIDVGTDQLHPSLRGDARIELHEKTDIRNFSTDTMVDIALIDVSFISMREVLPSVTKMLTSGLIVAMVKPQFEVGQSRTNRGVIKNNTQRRKILAEFELWVKGMAVIIDKADSEIAGAKGNLERFYLLKPILK